MPQSLTFSSNFNFLQPQFLTFSETLIYFWNDFLIHAFTNPNCFSGAEKIVNNFLAVRFNWQYRALLLNILGCWYTLVCWLPCRLLFSSCSFIYFSVKFDYLVKFFMCVYKIFTYIKSVNIHILVISWCLEFCDVIE